MARIGCLDPVESAADKLSALAWRVPDRNRNQADDDPAIVRHLHDLAILQELALAHAGFAELVIAAMHKDDRRAKRNASFAGLPIAEKFEQMLLCLTSDRIMSKSTVVSSKVCLTPKRARHRISRKLCRPCAAWSKP